MATSRHIAALEALAGDNVQITKTTDTRGTVFHATADNGPYDFIYGSGPTLEAAVEGLLAKVLLARQKAIKDAFDRFTELYEAVKDHVWA